VWREFANPEVLGAIRLAAMERFLEDYDAGKAAGRYVEGALPSLPFDDETFDLALCSHLLFLYSDQLDVAFHLAALQELLRVARDVRIFPLLALNCELSPHLPAVIAWCKAQGHLADLRRVPYEFQVGGDTMLHVVRSMTV
jgi:SAM-dependent methyltransferase